MSEDKKNQEYINEIQVVKPKVVKQKRVKKPKFPVSNYILEQDVEICGKDGVKTQKKGTKISLTKEGATYFKSKSYIK